MLTAVRMVPARAWNCSLKRARMQFQALGNEPETVAGSSLKTGSGTISGERIKAT